MPPVLLSVLGRDQGGVRAGPAQHPAAGPDYRVVIDNARAACIVWSPEFADEIAGALAGASYRPAHALPAEGEGDTFAARLAEALDALAPAPAAADDPAFWLYTSGSTGTPKGGVHRHRDMVVTSQYFGVDTLGITENDVHFSAAKLFFAYGIGNAMTFPLWTGGTAVLCADRPTPASTFATIEEIRPTIYYGVPTLYAAQLQALESASPDLSSVRLCVSAGEPLPAPLLERWRAATGLDIVDGIGTTESLHIFISNRPGGVAPGTSGTLVPGYEARLVDDDGRDVAPGEIGNLLIRGRSLIAEYWGEPERTAAAFDGAWLRTGDTYAIDEAGCYVCCGRSDDMLKVGGIWVSPVEIEARLIAHEAVLEAAVVGRADDDGLIKPEAWIVLAEGHAPSERPERGAGRPLQGRTGALQVSALAPLRRQSAQDRNRQDSALQTARGRLAPAEHRVRESLNNPMFAVSRGRGGLDVKLDDIADRPGAALVTGYGANGRYPRRSASFPAVPPAAGRLLPCHPVA